MTIAPRRFRLWWLVAGFLAGFLAALWAEELRLHWQNDRLRFSAPRLHFLAGRPLEKLKNGAPVNFDFALSLAAGSRTRVHQRVIDRFVVSYDLWEEKFSVTKVQAPRRTVSDLGAAAAEAWCLDQITVSTSGLAADQPLWARLEVRAGDAKDGPIFGRGNISESGISLTSLVEIFSRPAQAHESRWVLESGPLTLNEIRGNHGRGS